MTVQQTGDWARARRITRTLPQRFAIARDRLLDEEAALLHTIIRDGLLKQSPGGSRFRNLSPLTLASRRISRGSRGGGTRALMVSGELFRAIIVKRVSKRVFIGVRRGAKSRSGRSMVDIATLNEQGSNPIVIQITPKMRKFLAVLMRAAGRAPSRGRGRGVIVTRIPARPFLRPSFELWSRGALPRVHKRMLRLLPELQPGGS